MWLDNLKELKKKTGMSTKQIVEKTNLPERTVCRIFCGETDHPYADTLDLIVKALGYDLGDIFADTKVIVATDELVEIKGSVDVVEAERDLIAAENATLKEQVATLTAENAILKDKNAFLHDKVECLKDEIIAIHNYYIKLKSGD